MNLSGKVVLITGASRGLGRVMALGLAAGGANVAITARPGSEAALAGVVDAAAGAKGEVAAFIGDVSDAAACVSIVKKTVQRFGALHVLFNNAALGMGEVGPHISKVIPFYNVPVATWQRIVDTNVNGTFHMSLAAVPLFLAQKWGRIINLSTGMRTMLRAGLSPYGPSKAAVEAMTAIWAQDLAGSGVTVNALLPGWAADTGMVLPEDHPDRSRLVPPSAMVPPAVWLASDASDGVTGMRILAKDWNPSLPPGQAYQGASAKAGW
ncbi:MAG: hypothetical protein A3H35_16330 [Betaproteobacteria bacterium RIFCSPLOWO2_02_FULL_62_17]|nr:MAG: hypothetical protein A3H35_16330 [Betaproteobacteria bacterium RIFCSPLOWO2_02_FULL_62_17]